MGDGVACTDDSCDEANDVVLNLPNDANCDNGQFCDGVETCDALLDCQAGTPPVLDDGVGCTDDGCDEILDVVLNTPNDANCDNGLFCDGAETCDAALDCQPGTDPCQAGELCNEVADVCEQSDGAIVEFRADEADGANPYPIPGTGSPWVDLSGNGHDGSLFNFAGDANSGWQGTGSPSDPYRLEFDGTPDQRVTIPAASIPELNPTGSHTAMVWFQTDPSAGSPPAQGDREGVIEWVETFASPFEATSVSYLNGNLEFWDCTGSWLTLTPVDGDTWYHVAVTKEDLGGGNATVRVYLDGVQVYENLASTCLGDQASELVLGAHTAFGPGNYGREMSGAIGQATIFDSALNGAAVGDEFAADAPLYGKLLRIVEFRADEADGASPYPVPGTGSPWVDLTSNGHDGTLFNFAGDANSGWQGTGTPGDPYALEFDGTNDQRVTIPAASIPELNPVSSHTTLVWFKTDPTVGSPPANNDREGVIEWVETYASPFEATSVSYLNGNLGFWDCPDGGSWNTLAGLSGDTWYHVAVTKEDVGGGNAQVRVYLDGVQVYENLGSTCLGDQFSELVLGAHTSAGVGNYTREMSGAIGQFAVLNASLDGSGVTQEFLADAALYGKLPVGGEIVKFRADQADGASPYPIPGTGSPWVDLTGNGHDGTLANFAGDANSGWQGTGTSEDPYRLEFDGTNDQRVTIPAASIPELNPTGSHTAMVWFKTDPTVGSPPANNDREGVIEWVETFGNPYEATSVSYVNGNLAFWDCPDGGGLEHAGAPGGRQLVPRGRDQGGRGRRKHGGPGSTWTVIWSTRTWAPPAWATSSASWSWEPTRRPGRATTRARCPAPSARPRSSQSPWMHRRLRTRSRRTCRSSGRLASETRAVTASRGPRTSSPSRSTSA